MIFNTTTNSYWIQPSSYFAQYPYIEAVYIISLNYPTLILLLLVGVPKHTSSGKGFLRYQGLLRGDHLRDRLDMNSDAVLPWRKFPNKDKTVLSFNRTNIRRCSYWSKAQGAAEDKFYLYRRKFYSACYFTQQSVNYHPYFYQLDRWEKLSTLPLMHSNCFLLLYELNCNKEILLV